MRAIYAQKTNKYFGLMVISGLIFIVSLILAMIGWVSAGYYNNKDYPPDPLKFCGKEDRVINCEITPNFNCCENNTNLYCYNALQLNGYLCLDITNEFRAYSAEIMARHDEFGITHIVASIVSGICIISAILTVIFGFIKDKYSKLEKTLAAAENQAAAS